MNYIYNKIECGRTDTRKYLLEQGGKKNLEVEMGQGRGTWNPPHTKQVVAIPIVSTLFIYFWWGGGI